MVEFLCKRHVQMDVSGYDIVRRRGRSTLFESRNPSRVTFFTPVSTKELTGTVSTIPPLLTWKEANKKVNKNDDAGISLFLLPRSDPDCSDSPIRSFARTRARHQRAVGRRDADLLLEKACQVREPRLPNGRKCSVRTVATVSAPAAAASLSGASGATVTSWYGWSGGSKR
mmetsp:Transcript_20412/g.46349  ORF Transcript_20412/g.46349 Transcript_20412/m.46349 type:complete len:171 (-) Transcript_20412:550-1062(-)